METFIGSVEEIKCIEFHPSLVGYYIVIARVHQGSQGAGNDPLWLAGL